MSSNVLYSNFMKTLGMLLNSAGKTEILRALMYQPGPVGLRQVARIASVHPHSAELALAALTRDGLVKRRNVRNGALFELERSHEAINVLESVFTAAAKGFAQARSRTLNDRSKSILPFIKQACRMIRRARESRHVA